MKFFEEPEIRVVTIQNEETMADNPGISGGTEER